jgi:hypothetical protein
MDQLNTQYRQIIEQVLRDYAEFVGQEAEIEQHLVIDPTQNHYLLVETGWQGQRRIYGTLIHINLIDGKVWIQQDGTEEGVAYELEAAGIPKHHIVLAFKSIERRRITEYAVC